MAPERGRIPSWVAPASLQVRDCYRLDRQVADVTGAHDTLGQILALEWACGLRVAPLTQRSEQPVARDLARAESWVALCDAAGRALTVDDWQRLGVAPARPVPANAAFAYGAWRMLAWLLGERRDPPEELPRRDPDGTIPPWEQRYVAPPRPDSPSWQAAMRQRRERQRDEALAAYQLARRAG